MKYYFYPDDESAFKKAAINCYVRTIIFNISTGAIEQSFIRKVTSEWQQTCRNNIATDHRVKALVGNNFEIYSWVVKSNENLCLPSFVEFGRL